MREGINIGVSGADRERLAAVVADRNSPQKHVWRARIILATAEGCGTGEIMRRAGVSKPYVWRWQERFMREGVVGLLREKTRKPGLPPLLPALVERVVALTLTEPPGEATHWTGRAMAMAIGVSLRSVQRIWAAHRLQPHPRAAFQAVAGSGLCRQIARRGRVVSRPAGPQPGAFGRREVANSGPRPHAARPADEEGAGRNNDPRLSPAPRCSRLSMSSTAQ